MWCTFKVGFHISKPETADYLLDLLCVFAGLAYKLFRVEVALGMTQDAYNES